MKLLVPTSLPLDRQQLAQIDGAPELLWYDVRSPLPAAAQDAAVAVTWMNTRPGLKELTQLPNLRLVQALSAGTDQLEDAGFAPEVQIVAGTGLHDVPVAGHTLALILAAAKRLDWYLDDQRAHRWNPRHPQVGQFSFLLNAHVVIWGFGSIAATLAGCLSGLGARVSGIARSRGERSGVQVYTEEDLPQILADADVLVNLLPSTAKTQRIVNAEVLALLPARAWYINVGRGQTTDESALLSALEAGTLAGAALDVTQTEPLPPQSPLWDAPNLILTPHVAGGRPQGAEALIVANVNHWLAGEALPGQVDRRAHP